MLLIRLITHPSLFCNYDTQQNDTQRNTLGIMTQHNATHSNENQNNDDTQHTVIIKVLRITFKNVLLFVAN